MLPTGVVTFVLTDVVDSTGHWNRGDASAAMARQRELIAEAVADHGGVQPVEQGEGDSTVSAFASPGAALHAAVDFQRAIASEPWPTTPIRVRVGVHTGEAVLVDERTYGGQAIIRCARVRDLAHGGQILVTTATTALAQDALPDTASLRQLATIELRGLDRAETVHQLDHPDLARAFPALHGDIDGARLPSYATSFVGREREIADVRDHAAAARLVTVTGAGGSGKTRLAREVAAASVQDYADGVVWVDLSRVDRGSSVASEVAGACGLVDSPGGPDAATVLARHLARNHRLVVLDNCEHVLDAAAAVAEAVLAHDGPSVLLATSREPLGVAGETTWRIPSLEIPGDSSDNAAAAEAGAVVLFRERARAAQPSFVPDSSTLPAVVAICRRLDGIPLAIELAAARLRTMSLDDLVTGLDDRFRLLAAGRRSLERQRTLTASIDWSHDLLAADERTLFRRLGVFAAPFSLAAAEVVGADEQLDGLAVFEVLSHLVDKSLVQHDDRGYSMLETIRQYALTKAVDAGETTSLRERHLRWFLDQVDRWGFARDIVTLDAFHAANLSAPDVRVALDWALVREPAAASLLVEPLAGGIGYSGRFMDADDLARYACGHEPPGTAAWAELLAPLMYALPQALVDWWIAPATSALDDDALTPRARRRLRFGLVQTSLWIGDKRATDVCEDLLDEGRRDHDDALVGWVSCFIALAAVMQGNLPRVEPLVAWSERRYQHHNITLLMSGVRTLLHLMRGETSTALDIVLRRPAGYRKSQVDYGTDAMTALMAREPSVLEAAVNDVQRREFDGFTQWTPSYVRFWAAVEAGDLDLASVHVAAMIDSTQMPATASNFCTYAARIALARGDVETALRHVERATTLGAGHDQPLGTASAALSSAEVSYATGESARAVDHAHDALDIAEHHQLRVITVPILEFFAVAAADRGELDLAGRLLGACGRFRSHNGFKFVWPNADRLLAAVRPRLDPDHLLQGAELSIEDAVQLARAGRGHRNRPTFGWEALTPAEVRVVELAADGLSNQQIADKVFASVATVKTHLVHSYRKLALDSRAELIAAALTRRAELAARGAEPR